MTDELQLRREANAAIRAKAILEDELVVAAFAEIAARIHEGWEGSLFENTAAREDAYRMLRALRAFKAQFEALIQGGALARVEIDQNEAAERRKEELRHG
ncbi:MAG TPA: hypothetical protein VKB42_02805 [Dongiaceae bacterium]|nr:hypothetical protein [Dongiaceae bacterium]